MLVSGHTTTVIDKDPARGVPPAWLIAVLFLFDFLQRFHTLLALGMEDQDALFHHFALTR